MQRPPWCSTSRHCAAAALVVEGREAQDGRRAGAQRVQLVEDRLEGRLVLRCSAASRRRPARRRSGPRSSSGRASGSVALHLVEHVAARRHSGRRGSTPRPASARPSTALRPEVDEARAAVALRERQAAQSPNATSDHGGGRSSRRPARRRHRTPRAASSQSQRRPVVKRALHRARRSQRAPFRALTNPSQRAQAAIGWKRDRRMRIRLLGPVELWADGREVPVGGPKQRALLALLASGSARSCRGPHRGGALGRAAAGWRWTPARRSDLPPPVDPARGRGRSRRARDRRGRIPAAAA